MKLRYKGPSLVVVGVGYVVSGTVVERPDAEADKLIATGNWESCSAGAASPPCEPPKAPEPAPTLDGLRRRKK